MLAIWLWVKKGMSPKRSTVRTWLMLGSGGWAEFIEATGVLVRAHRRLEERVNRSLLS
jgi:hypothetical protein